MNATMTNLLLGGVGTAVTLLLAILGVLLRQTWLTSQLKTSVDGLIERDGENRAEHAKLWEAIDARADAGGGVATTLALHEATLTNHGHQIQELHDRVGPLEGKVAELHRNRWPAKG